jgi:hypothetical protein
MSGRSLILKHAQRCAAYFAGAWKFMPIFFIVRFCAVTLRREVLYSPPELGSFLILRNRQSWTQPKFSNFIEAVRRVAPRTTATAWQTANGSGRSAAATENSKLAEPSLCLTINGPSALSRVIGP